MRYPKADTLTGASSCRMLNEGVCMNDQEPPEPPQVAPKILLNRSEKIGLPFLFLLPVLASIGIFGPHTETAEARSGSVHLSAEYPSRLRFENSDRLLVRVHNLGSTPVSKVSLAFDPAYIHSFSQVTFDPAPEFAYSLAIENLEPDESRLIAVHLTAERYGPHKGWISLAADGAETTRLRLRTFIFP